MRKKFFLNTLFIFSILIGCNGQKEPKLLVPDYDSSGNVHGYNYTLLGLFLYAPWEYRKDYFQGLFIQNSPDTGKVNNHATILSYTKDQKDLVFEFQKNYTLFYWFKKDYIESPDDTLTLLDGTKSFKHVVLPSTRLKIKKIYTNGTWSYDSSSQKIKIDFGKNEFNLKPILGRYINLNSTEMTIEEIEEKDVSDDTLGKKTKKVTTHNFIH